MLINSSANLDLKDINGNSALIYGNSIEMLQKQSIKRIFRLFKQQWVEIMLPIMRFQFH
jgi:hypothetical protein